MTQTPTEVIPSSTTIEPEESKYRGQVEDIKRRSNDILEQIQDFENNSKALREQQEYERERKMKDRLRLKKSDPFTPRTFESLHEEELDLRAQLQRLKKKNSRLKSQVDDMKKLLADSEAKERELQDELDFTYQKRLLLSKKLEDI